MVSIKELLDSTVKMGESLISERTPENRYAPKYTFSMKPFGSIYSYNRTVVYRPNHSIIEIIMYISRATEKYRTAHRVAMAIKLQEGLMQEYDVKGVARLVRRQRDTSRAVKDMTDIEILNLILNGKFNIKEGNIIQSEKDRNKFLLIPNRIPLESHIQVNCSCSSYLYSFSWYNADHKCHIGRRPPKYIKYVGKTKGELKNINPVRNPQKLPGMCKHLMLLVALLMNGNILQKDATVVGNYTTYDDRLTIHSRTDITRMVKKLEDQLREDRKLQAIQRTESVKIEKEANKIRSKYKRPDTILRKIDKLFDNSKDLWKPIKRGKVDDY